MPSKFAQNSTSPVTTDLVWHYVAHVHELYVLLLIFMRAGTLSASSSVTVKMYPTSRFVYIDWDFTATPDIIVSKHTEKLEYG